MGGSSKTTNVDGAGTGGETLRLITPELVGDELRRAEVVGSSGSVHLEMVPGNPDRCDFATRVSFKVYRSRTPICFVTIGRKLGDLWRRTKGFAEACPEIACRPLFYRKTKRWDIVGVEFFEGADLESQVMNGTLNPGDATEAAGRVLSVLDRTMRPSHIEAAAREFDHFGARVCASAMFGGLDQGFLREVILPYVRSGALRGPQRNRWSNGDFIPRNILIDERRKIRLVDHEFSARTHFFGEDWWRWKTFSRLPEEVRALPTLRDSIPDADWLEAYFILRQIVLVHEINGAHLAVTDARQHIARLLALVSAAHAGFRGSVFFGAAPSVAATPASRNARDLRAAQLFWSSDGTFEEENSKRLQFSPQQEAALRFVLPVLSGRVRLRFDPVDTPGLIRVSALRIRDMKTNTPVLAVTTIEGWNSLKLGGGLLRLADSPDLNLLSVDNDPILLLPEVDVGEEPRELAFEVWLQFTENLAGLPELLAHLSLPAPPANPQIETQLHASEAVADLQAHLDSEASGRADALIRLQQSDAELNRRTAQLEESAQAASALQDELTHRTADRDAVRRDLAAREEAISQLAMTIAHLQQATVDAAAQLEARAEENTALATQVAQLEARLDSESAARTDALARLNEANERVSSLRTLLDLLRQEQSAAQTRESDLEVQVAGLEHQLAASLARAREQSTAIAGLESTHHAASEEWARERAALEGAIREQATFYENERDSSAGRLVTLELKVEELQSALNAKDAANTALSADLATLRDSAVVRLSRTLRLLPETENG